MAMLFAASAHAQEAGENMLGRQTQNEGFFAVPAKGSVKIDGTLDEWDLSGQIWSYADTSVRDSFSVKTAAMWDADNLYLSFVWRDPMPLNSLIDPKFDAERGWMVDAVQLRVPVAGSSTGTTRPRRPTSTTPRKTSSVRSRRPPRSR